MKKKIDMEFMWHLDEVVIPFPVAIVTTVNEEGRVNAAPFGLLLPFCSDPARPQMLLCASVMWHTAANIKATGDFVINYVPFSLMKQVAQCGVPYSEGVNELEKAGLTPLPADTVRPPRIQEGFQHIECRLDQVIQPTEAQVNFIGDVVGISMNEELLGKTREERLRLADPLMLFGVEVTILKGDYARVGEAAGYAPPLTDVE